MLSDNGTNFKLAAKAINVLWTADEETEELARSIFNNNKVKAFAASKGIRWQFIVERASWRGGFYERMVALVKYPLRRSIGKRLLSYEELNTLLIEIERICNERPLTYISEAEVDKPIRPVDFLIPYPNNMRERELERPDKDDPDFEIKRSSRDQLIENYKLGLESANKFWKTFIEHYLITLREKAVGEVKQGQSLPELGEPVIIYDHETPRNQWRLGKIAELIPGKDGQIRTAKIIVGKGKSLTRSISHLYPLECREGTGERQTSLVSAATAMETITLEYSDGEQERSEQQASSNNELRVQISTSQPTKRKTTPAVPAAIKAEVHNVREGIDSLKQWNLFNLCEGSAHRRCKELPLAEVTNLFIKGNVKRGAQILQWFAEEVRRPFNGKSIMHVLLTYVALRNGEDMQRIVSFAKLVKNFEGEELMNYFYSRIGDIGKRGKVKEEQLYFCTMDNVQRIVELWIESCAVARKELLQHN